MENEDVKNETERTDTPNPGASAAPGLDLTFRDDLFDYDWLLDQLRKGRPRSLRFRVVDSGVLDGAQLEKLIRGGADLYTSDRVRHDILELEFILKAARAGGSVVASFLFNDIVTEEEHGFIPLDSLAQLGRQGLFLHVSNRERKREWAALETLAVQCRKGGSRLVYYHHGKLDEELMRLAREGAWLHISSKSLRTEEDVFFLTDMAASARMTGAGCVLYVEKHLDYVLLHETIYSPALVLFKTPPVDFKSPLRPLVEEAAKKRGDFRAFYLYSTFLA